MHKERKRDESRKGKERENEHDTSRERIWAKKEMRERKGRRRKERNRLDEKGNCMQK